MRVNFQEVAIRSSKSGCCPRCDKRASRSEKFWQTINPFNKTADGRVKGRNDIYAELMIKRDAWAQEPVYHAKCEEAERLEKRAALSQQQGGK